MNFKFNVSLTDKDYLDFNLFTAFNTSLGKKQLLKIRVMVAMIFLLSIAFVWIMEYSIAPLYTVLILIVSILFQLFIKRYYALIVKRNIKAMKKAGKSGYTSEYEMCFYDDFFAVTTPCEKNESKYAIIEDVIVSGEKAVYIYVGAINAYILPFSCFESKEQWDAFVAFIKTKCDKVTSL